MTTVGSISTPSKSSSHRALSDNDNDDPSNQPQHDTNSNMMNTPLRTTTTTTTTTTNKSSRRPGLMGGRSPFKAIADMRQRHHANRKKRRTHSAPPALRRPLIEQHFNVERNELGRTRVLPGAIKHEEDWNRDVHDYFNLIVLVPIVALNVMNWNWEILSNHFYKEMFGADSLTGMSKKYVEQLSIPNAWTGDYFDLFFWATVTYFVVDLLWIVMVPTSVKSPSVIFQHHIATILYILIPYFQPDVRWCMGACMSVEINTWFLIARRVFNKQGFPPWSFDLGFVSIRVKLISICFYVTWIAIRDMLYPAMMGYIVNRWWTESQRVGSYINIEAIPPVLHSIFCILNLKWTYDLLMSKVRYYRRKGKRSKHVGGGSPSSPPVDKGL